MITARLIQSICTLLVLHLMCSCVVTTTTEPYVPGETPKIDHTATQRNKKRFKLFEKKPGNAIADYQRDRRKGILRLKQFGAPGPLTPYYNRLLEEELGIDVEIIDDGIVSKEMLRYGKEYNALMTQDIQKKYGPGILNEARRRAAILHAQVQNSGES